MHSQEARRPGRIPAAVCLVDVAMSALLRCELHVQARANDFALLVTHALPWVLVFFMFSKPGPPRAVAHLRQLEAGRGAGLKLPLVPSSGARFWVGV
mmetsp:Transcript_31495/g.75438  ORF Transcript_31495/g.75438 Transcript_31495/m.75438 type:complete len:97 (+) Transcript_31495:1384-1674(+)